MHQEFGTEQIRVEAQGSRYEEMVSDATIRALSFLAGDQQILRHVPEYLEKPTWCLVDSACVPSLAGTTLSGAFTFEYVYPEDVL